MHTAAALIAAHDTTTVVPFGWWFPFIPLAWFAMIAILFGVFGRRRWRNSRPDPARQAEATLADRYARGDIDEEEYRRRREVLHANSALQDY